jgi:glycerophosphoryl diester phosphodiesterase
MRMLQGMMRKILTGLLALPLLAACSAMPDMGGGSGASSSGASSSGDWPYATLGGKRPLVIAHRGASGALPEHTLEAYLRALNDGADCIEPDLVMTKDGVLVDRHDTWLSTTTNVASKPEFANRKRKSSDPEASDREDWWVADFTLAELKTLRAIQPFRGRSKVYDNLYAIPTFDEVLKLAKANHTVRGGPVCVYPEAKSPAYHDAIGHKDMAEKILASLKAHGLDARGSPVFIQSFEPPFVKKMAGMTELPVVMLVGDKGALDAAMKVEGAPFWDGLGATHQLLFNEDGSPSRVIRDAHGRGIAVHTWTYRDDAPFRGEDIGTSIRKALALGLDGFFTDFPATGFRVVNEVEHGASAEQPPS